MTPALPSTEPIDADTGERALAWLHTARFLTTASKLSELPVGELPEIAFVGRSNAGKSSAINALTGQKRLAFASKTPGRTQHINLFEVGPKDAPNALLADLPGYGYAAVERTAKVRWQEVMASYLEVRRNLEAIVLLVDSRLGITPNDAILLDFVRPRVSSGSVKLLVLLTKVDKLNKSELRSALTSTRTSLSGMGTPEAEILLAPFSATQKVGLHDAAVAIEAWRAPPRGA